jgi:predicted dinucleotide-binding enzyme
MPNVTIIGTGNMGQAIAGVLTKGGATVDSLGHHDDGDVRGDVVVFAVPYTALTDVLSKFGDRLDGKVVVDITNPLNLETFDSLTVAPDGSSAAELAERLPGAKVLKAFNTNFAATLASGTVGGETTTVLIAGDDADAKAELAALVTAGGLRAVDAGSLRRARELEALGFLQITLAAAERIPWTGGFAVQS